MRCRVLCWSYSGRIGPGAVGLATLLLSAVSVWFSGQHLGPFAAFEPDVTYQVLLIQAYLVIVVGPALQIGRASCRERV